MYPIQCLNLLSLAILRLPGCICHKVDQISSTRVPAPKQGLWFTKLELHSCLIW